MNDIIEFQRSRPHVNYRFEFIPAKPLLKRIMDEIRFTQEDMEPMIE